MCALFSKYLFSMVCLINKQEISTEINKAVCLTSLEYLPREHTVNVYEAK